MGNYEAGEEAVLGVKYDLAAMLCLSRQSGVSWGGGGKDREK